MRASKIQYVVGLLVSLLLVGAARAEVPQVRVIAGGESKTNADACRGILVGPGVNQPDPFPGWAGFVGWESPIRLKSGVWIVGFNAGYWHASPPTPVQYPPQTLAEYRKMGMPADINAPTGGRAMFIRSTNEGKTWSKPQTLTVCRLHCDEWTSGRGCEAQWDSVHSRARPAGSFGN